MKHFACIIMLLLACLPPIVAQELSDSAFWDAEMEDSISAMAIMPVKKPKKLLDSIITRLLYDMERKPIARKYKVENTFVVGSTPSFKVKYILSAETGIEMKIVTGEDFSFEGLSGSSISLYLGDANKNYLPNPGDTSSNKKNIEDAYNNHDNEAMLDMGWNPYIKPTAEAFQRAYERQIQFFEENYSYNIYDIDMRPCIWQEAANHEAVWN